MSEKPAAMAAKLVSMKNVSTYGSVELRLHMPQELALKAIQIFGWPTMENPISVAIARLEEESGAAEPAAEREEPPAQPPTGRHWSDLTPAQQTGVIRNEPAFWEFTHVGGPEGARNFIRNFCGVRSCADILPGTDANGLWSQLQIRYGHFLRQRNNAA